MRFKCGWLSWGGRIARPGQQQRGTADRGDRVAGRAAG